MSSRGPDMSSPLHPDPATANLVNVVKFDGASSIPVSNRVETSHTEVTAAELQRKIFDPIRFVIPGYITEGLTILGGRPKLGKSWLCLDMAIAVAGGREVLGIGVSQGDVLYLALEDNQRRLQQRLKMIFPANEAWPETLHLRTDWSRLNDGGVKAIDSWLNEHPKARMVIIDTFACVRPSQVNRSNAYEADYSAASPLQVLARRKGIAIVIVHHVRKMAADDPLETVSGTNGLTGAADTVLILKRDGRDTTLYGRGRDIEEIETGMEFCKETCRWVALGNNSQSNLSDSRQEILDVLQNAPRPMSPSEIAKHLHKPEPTIRQMVTRMHKDGHLIRQSRGRYYAPDVTPVTQ